MQYESAVGVRRSLRKEAYFVPSVRRLSKSCEVESSEFGLVEARSKRCSSPLFLLVYLPSRHRPHGLDQSKTAEESGSEALRCQGLPRYRRVEDSVPDAQW